MMNVVEGQLIDVFVHGTLMWSVIDRDAFGIWKVTDDDTFGRITFLNIRPTKSSRLKPTNRELFSGFVAAI